MRFATLGLHFRGLVYATPKHSVAIIKRPTLVCSRTYRTFPCCRTCAAVRCRLWPPHSRAGLRDDMGHRMRAARRGGGVIGRGHWGTPGAYCWSCSRRRGGHLQHNGKHAVPPGAVPSSACRSPVPYMPHVSMCFEPRLQVLPTAYRARRTLLPCLQRCFWVCSLAGTPDGKAGHISPRPHIYWCHAPSRQTWLAVPNARPGLSHGLHTLCT